MRSSDWSSDVCSSDLPQRRGDLARIAHAFAMVAQHMGELLEIDVAQLVADVAALLAVFDDLAAAVLVHRPVVADPRDVGRVEAVAGSTGRASCRERVFPYAAVPVVPAPLKKKT